MIIATTDALVKLVTDTFPKDILKEVDKLPGRLNDEMLNRFMTTQPSVYFAFVGGRSSTQSHDARIDANWVAYVVTGREDDPRVPGPDNIMDVLIPLIHNHTITDVGTLICNRIDNLFSIGKDKKGARVHAITFSIPNFSFDYQVDLTKLNNFVTYYADHSMAVGNDEPKAEDTIVLPQ